MTFEEDIVILHDKILSEKIQMIKNRLSSCQYPMTIIYCSSSPNNEVLTNGFTHFGSSFQEAIDNMKFMIDFESFNRIVKSLGNEKKQEIKGYNLLIPIINHEYSMLFDFFYIKNALPKFTCKGINMTEESPNDDYSYDEFMSSNSNVEEILRFASVNMFDIKEESKNKYEIIYPKS